MAELPKGVIPHIAVDNAAAAIEFYKKAFGAKEVSRAPHEDGRIMHAGLEINGSALYLSDDFPEYAGDKSRTPKALGGSPMVLHLNVPNADEAIQQAAAAGAKVTMRAADQFWGARYGQVLDPFGYTWAFMHSLKK